MDLTGMYKEKIKSYNQKAIDIENGVFLIDDNKRILIASDYPYYRDDPENWENRLTKLKELNVNTITCYVPWRHHAIKNGDAIEYDFCGKTLPNRNIKKFISLAQSMSFYVIVKPGPFIHAEVNFGGLPDWVDASTNQTVEAMVDSKGNNIYYENEYVLPAPLSSEYMSLVQEWYEVVSEKVFQGCYYPEGPIIAVQIMNEGIYSNVGLSVFDHDYSKSSKMHYALFLKDKYKTVLNYNELHSASIQSFTEIIAPSVDYQIRDSSDILKIMDWSSYQSSYLGTVYQKYKEKFEGTVPLIANISCPLHGDSSVNDWITRVNTKKMDDLHYAFTSWVGVISRNQNAFINNLIAAKFEDGPNIETNWGFSILYDSLYKYAVTPFCQTLFSIANGAMGFNIYTGVSTDKWDENVDNKSERPYPDSSPIGSDGSTNRKYDVLKFFNLYLQTYEYELIHSQTDQPVGLVYYEPYSYLSSWKECNDHNSNNIDNIFSIDSFIKSTISELRLQNFDFALKNIQDTSLLELSSIDNIVFASGKFLDRETQQKLVSYVINGGNLIFIGQVPELDLDFTNCHFLKEELFGNKLTSFNSEFDKNIIQKNEKITIDFESNRIFYTNTNTLCGLSNFVGKGKLLYFPSISTSNEMVMLHQVFDYLIENKSIIADGSEVQTWCRRFNDINHLFLLSTTDKTKKHRIMIKDGREGYDSIVIKLPAYAGATIRIENNQVTSYFIKGINEEGISKNEIELSINGNLVCKEENADLIKLDKDTIEKKIN